MSYYVFCFFALMSCGAVAMERPSTHVIPKRPSSLIELCTGILVNAWKDNTGLAKETIEAAKSLDTIDAKNKKLLINRLLAANNLLQDEIQKVTNDICPSTLTSPDGKRNLRHNSKERVFEVYEEGKEEKFLALEGNCSRYRFLQWGRQGTIVYCLHQDEGCVAKIWDSLTGKLLREIPLRYFDNWIICTPDDRKIAIKTFTSPIIVYDIANNAEYVSISGTTDGPDFDISPNGTLIAQEDSLDSKIYDINTGKMVKTVKGNKWPQFSHDGKYITVYHLPVSSYHKPQIIISDIATCRVIKAIDINVNESVKGIAISPHCNQLKIIFMRNNQVIQSPFFDPLQTSISAILAYVTLKNNKKENQKLCANSIALLKEPEHAAINNLFEQEDVPFKHNGYFLSNS